MDFDTNDDMIELINTAVVAFAIMGVIYVGNAICKVRDPRPTIEDVLDRLDEVDDGVCDIVDCLNEIANHQDDERYAMSSESESNSTGSESEGESESNESTIDTPPLAPPPPPPLAPLPSVVLTSDEVFKFE